MYKHNESESGDNAISCYVSNETFRISLINNICDRVG
jgi:hypothetical protein